MEYHKVPNHLEKKELLSSEFKSDFCSDLIELFRIIKSFSPKKVGLIISICKELYKEYTKPFYDKWSFLDFVERDFEYEKDYYSFMLTYRGSNIHSGSKILIPHRMLIYQTLKPDNNIIDQLTKAEDTKYFFWTLNKIQRVLNLPLLPNDIKILKIILDPLIRNRIPSILTNRQIAMLSGCSENTVYRRIENLINRAMFTNAYRLNISRLGYYTSSIIHQEHFDDLPSNFEPYCLFDVPIDWGETVGKIKIFQIPNTKKHLMGEIKDYFNSLYDITLTKSYIGWNLAGLKPDPNDRWNTLPPIFLGDRWSDKLIAEGSGLEYDLFNDISSVKISKTQARMLDLLQIEATSKIHLSQTLGITQKYVQQYYNYFFEQKLIDRFPYIGHCGLDSKVWITLLGSKSNNNFDLLNDIVEHLKFFPFSWLFYNEKNLDKEGRPFLAGLIWIPSSWFVDFYSVWIHLNDLGFVPKVNINQGMVKWDITIYDTYDYEGSSFQV